MLIAGEWVPSETGRVLAITDPATGELVGEVPSASAVDVDKACEAASTAFSSWRRVPAAYVYCGDGARGLQLAEQCEAGSVWVNGIHRTYNLVPFGGYKESGLGREKSRFGLDEYVELKTIYLTHQTLEQTMQDGELERQAKEIT